MSTVSRQLVLEKLAETFVDPRVMRQALQSLDRYGKSDSEPNTNAVHLAIIKLSEGKLWRIRELVQKARKDFRDVLYPVQAPEVFQRLDKTPPPLWNELRRKSKGK